jgi:hypothetical protein
MKLKNTELLQINNALNYLQAPATAQVLSSCLGIRRAIKPLIEEAFEIAKKQGLTEISQEILDLEHEVNYEPVDLSLCPNVALTHGGKALTMGDLEFLE